MSCSKVPVGTIVYDLQSGELVHDFSQPNERVIVAHGGRGGRGNQHFATSTHQAPREHEDGRQGDERHLRLELKLLADVGIVGYPNVGKSTLISRISAAKPKIADYPFTTLEPNLGVVSIGELSDPKHYSFVVADIPGLIEGAHKGAGLGMQFLRHIERTRMLVHVVDVSESSGRPDPVKDFEVIMEELKSFGAGLEKKPMIVVASKIDVLQKTSPLVAKSPSPVQKSRATKKSAKKKSAKTTARSIASKKVPRAAKWDDKLTWLETFCKKKGLPLYPISAVTGEGVDKLKYAMGKMVQEARRADAA